MQRRAAAETKDHKDRRGRQQGQHRSLGGRGEFSSLASLSLLYWLNGNSKKNGTMYFPNILAKRKQCAQGVKKKLFLFLSPGSSPGWDNGWQETGAAGVSLGCPRGISQGLGKRTQPFLVPAGVGLMTRQLERKEPWFSLFVWLSQMTGGREMIFFLDNRRVWVRADDGAESRQSTCSDETWVKSQRPVRVTRPQEAGKTHGHGWGHSFPGNGQ